MHELLVTSSGHPFLAKIPLKDCRILRGVRIPCVTGGHNPFVEGLVRYASSGNIGDIEEVLGEFYATFRPSSSAELLGIESSGAGTSKVSPFGSLEPWEGVSSARQARRGRRWALGEQGQHGVGASKVLGWRHFGPMDPKGVRFEARRLRAVYDSIAANGYVRHDGPDGDIRVVVLEDESGVLRYCVVRGHHRAAALAALNHADASVRINAYRVPRVRASDAQGWAAVVRKELSATVALAIFRRIHSGAKIPALDPWISASIQK